MLFVALTLTQLVLQEGFPAPTRALRDAQAEFESVRRMHLPVRHSGAQRCDATIGRFCYWHDSTPPPEIVESERITRARERVLATLDSASRAIPEDPWIAGQRTRYLIDAKRPHEAATLACGTPRWWCSALHGLALHVARRYAEADSAFTQALAAMPDSLRCDWHDISLLLEGTLGREIEEASCAERARTAETLWRLAQPLWITAGNDARTEHFARHTMALILAGSATPHGLRWAPDMRELLLRYGWSEVHTRDLPASALTTSWSVLGHGREPSWQLYPVVPSVSGMWLARESWQLSDPGARMRYAPRHLASLADLPHQLTRIPAGDSMSLILSTRIAGARLVVLPGRTMRDTLVVSVEAVDTAARRGLRSRYSVAPLGCASGAPCLSDLMLFTPVAGDDSVTLAEAVGRVAMPPFARGGAIGIWWHLRAAPGPVTMTLVVEPVRTPALRRALEALRLTRTRSTTVLRWQAAQLHDTASAQVSVTLPSAARGRYRISLTTEQRGGRVGSAREIDISP